ncbi:hypothetical protein GBAR_LOCUS7549, partial [Geodia barretti]
HCACARTPHSLHACRSLFESDQGIKLRKSFFIHFQANHQLCIVGKTLCIAFADSVFSPVGWRNSETWPNRRTTPTTISPSRTTETGSRNQRRIVIPQ